MAFNFGSPNESSDDEAVADVSAWQSGAKSKRTTPPRRTSGFQAVNQPPPEDIAMQSTPEPELQPVLAPRSAPVAQMQPATEPTVISSGEESSPDEEEEEPAPAVPTALPIEVEDDDDDIWATVDEVVGDFAVAEEDEELQVQESPEQRSDSEEEEVPQVQQRSERQLGSEEESDNLSITTRSVEVVISRDELSDDERADCVDFTAGSDVVLRVLSEREDSHEMMEYTVEFEDYHVDEVRFCM